MIRNAGTLDDAVKIFSEYVSPAPRGKNIPPTFDQVSEFVRERAVDDGEDVAYYLMQAEKAFEFYENNMKVLGCRTWKDGQGNPVKNWKLKIMNNWLRS